MFAVSERSQLKQFSNLFSEMKAAEFKISTSEKEQFKSIIKYLSKHNTLYKTSTTLGFNPETVFADESSWSISNKIIDTLGVVVIKDFNYRAINKFPNYSFRNFDNKQTFDVADYDCFKRLYFKKLKTNNEGVNTEFIRDYQFSLNHDKSLFNIKTGKGNEHQIDLNPLIEELLLKEDKRSIPNSLVFIEKEFIDVRIKLFVWKLNLTTKKDNIVRIRQFDVSVFVGEITE